MVILLFVLFVLLAVTFGFWDALAAVVGAAAVAVLVVILAVAVLALGGYLMFRRITRRGSP